MRGLAKAKLGSWRTNVGRGRGLLLCPPKLRESVAHFARRNARSAETEMGGSDDGNAHTVCFMIANEEVVKNDRQMPDKVVSGVNSPGNSCGGLCLA